MKKIFTGITLAEEKRSLTELRSQLFVCIAIILSLFQIWSVTWGKLNPMNQMAIHLSLILGLTFLIKRTAKSKAAVLFDYVAVLLVLAAGVYYSLHAERIAVRIPIMEPLTSEDIFFGLVFVLFSLEAARRTIGLPIVIISLIGIGYARWGHFFEGMLGHRPFTTVEVLDDLAFSLNGLWGSPISVAASFVFMFILFGAFLNKAGAGEFFFQLSTAIAGRTKGGAAKVAVLASAFFGSISGSPTANVVTTGAFTIPVSKKTGYKPTFAAAVEAAASTGGSILPPIMGSSAFLMAAVTQLPYEAIVLAAIVPGILYYVSLLAMVHFEALRLDLPRASKDSIPKISAVLKDGWHYFVPLVVLITFLLAGASASRTGFYGIMSVILISFFRKNTRMGWKRITAAMIDGAKSAIPVTTACAAAGLVIAGIMSTGLGGKLTSIVLGLTEGMLLPTLLLIMVICIILGMGMPVAAAYILTAMLAAPALIELGVPIMAAHLFIVYFSIFSAITPPVAVAAFAAAGIADANPNRVGIEAVRLGLVGFIVPFLFVFEPSLLLNGSAGEILTSVLSALLGVVMLAAGLIGWLIRKASMLERLLLIAIGFFMMYPGVISDLVGIGFIGVVVLLQWRRSRRASNVHKKQVLEKVYN
ncbi:TRAP transporter permease [Virgibacillus halodenitrificans]|uniref:TRAP transporter permease n=1 Tax=Virgibacillus halodenitrificans TaxID=1482 RepID=A0ABR7VKH1_VIRHA|nr:TRAP transporter permease [Virgibacillus halodenitrificans]MBD1222418.1 TRAP transporter permease [Virgibacillus halodenitrificans]MEC2157714.1 TRAP transporter permease [Virgibacillus halodenitrificans]